MTYEELQIKAKSLGLKYVAVSKKQLEQSISQAEANVKASTEAVVKTEKDANTAVVLNKGQEVRRYTLEDHGDDFVKLAEQFANDRDYSVRFMQVKAGIPCPSCGYVVFPDEQE